MEVGEERLTAMKPGNLGRLWLLHLYDQLALPDVFQRADLGAGVDIIIVVEATAVAGSGLHVDFVPLGYQLAHAVGHHADAELHHLDLARNPDSHERRSPLRERAGEANPSVSAAQPRKASIRISAVSGRMIRGSGRFPFLSCSRTLVPLML